MIDANLLLTDFDRTAERLATKKMEREPLERARSLLEQRKQVRGELDDARARLNRISEQIGELFRAGRKDEAQQRRDEAAQIKARVAELEARIAEVEGAAEQILLRVPNLPHPDAPVGAGEEDNRTLRVEGYDAADYEGRSWRPHWEIAEELGIYDADRAAKISGSMFAVLRNEGARLLRALVDLGLELNRDRYDEFVVPHLVRTDTFTATGQLPKFADEAYQVEKDDLWAIPTGEVPLMGLHRDEMLDAEALPLRYMTHTACFRREAGSAGKDTRGMQRLHEFHKVELVRLCREEQVDDEFRALLEDAERPLRLLGLPYRVVELCTGDLTFTSARVYDLEVYAPGVDRWLEVSSVGIFTDFQARRGSIRYRRAGQKPEFVHALNGSGLATPRVWAALIEHGQQPDGSVRLPEALAERLGFDTIGPRA